MTTRLFRLILTLFVLLCSSASPTGLASAAGPTPDGAPSAVSTAPAPVARSVAPSPESLSSDAAPASSLAPKPIDPSLLLSRDPLDPQAEQAYRTAFQSMERGRLSSATIASLQDLVARYPFVPRYKEALGAAQVAQAFEHWAESLPDAADGKVPKGPTDSIELFVHGIQRIEEAIQLQPNTPDFYVTLGWAHLANTRIAIDRTPGKSRRRAQEAFDEAIRLNPSEPAYWQALGDFYRLSPSPTTSSMAPKDRGGKAGAAAPAASKAGSAASSTVPPGIAAYRRVLADRPRDAGLRFALYQAFERMGDPDRALEELRLVQQYDRGNAVPHYLLASIYFKRSDESRGEAIESDWRAQAVDALDAAQGARSFAVSPYRPAYPSVLAPALRRALGDSLTPETLELYDRLKSLAGRAVTEGDIRQAAGDPEGAERLYGTALTLGQRLVSSAMSASGRYLLHLPELSAGLSAQELALSSLKTLYDKYAMTDRLPWMQAQQLSLDEVRRMVKDGADAAAREDRDE